MLLPVWFVVTQLKSIVVMIVLHSRDQLAWGRPWPYYQTPSGEGGHIQSACWGPSPALLIATQPSLSMWV